MNIGNRFSLKSQVSIFIIIGAIIVLGLAAFFTIRGDFNVFSDGKDSYEIKEFVDSCLEIQTKEAMKQVGLHGGYLYHNVPDQMFADYTTDELLVKRMQGFKDLGEVKRPYLLYYDDRKQEYVNNVPDFDGIDDNGKSIRAQVRRHLVENLDSCVRDFEDFSDRFDVRFDRSQEELKLFFEDDEVIVKYELPLEITAVNTNVTEFISKFGSEQENLLYVPYYLMTDIVAAEENGGFIESKSLSFMSPYATKDNREMLPPIYPELELELKPSPWNLIDVQDLVKKILSSNMNKIKFESTEPEPNKVPEGLEDSEFTRQFVDAYTQPYLLPYMDEDRMRRIGLEYKNYNVDTMFDIFYPMYFDVKPSSGGILHFPKTESFFGILPMFMTKYSSSYELTYPVMFTIKSKKSPDTDFEFTFAVESNIYANAPLRDTLSEGETPFEGELLDGGKSYLCDYSQFISAPVLLNISDPVQDGERGLEDPLLGVEDATITFDCRGIETCYVGNTQINGDYVNRNLTKLAFRLPINCNPGTLEIAKPGHKKLIFENLNPTLETPIDLGTIEMSSLKTIELVVGMKEEDSLHEGVKSIPEGLKAFLLFTPKDDEDLTKIVQITSENQNDLTVDLTLGEYDVMGYVFYDEPFEIPKEKKCYDDGLFDEDCYTIDAINLNSWIIGGIEADINVREKDLLTKDRIVVTFVDLGIPGSIDELEAAANALDNLDEVNVRKPYFTSVYD